MNQAIVIGCLHSQQRSVFKNFNRGYAAWELLKIKLEYDNGVCSDSIMMCKVYEEWCKIFHSEHSKVTLEDDKVSRRPKVSRNRDELKWCRDRFLDWSILKETLILIEEIRYRFINLGVPADLMNSRVPYNKDGLNTLRSILSAAFYRRYIRAEYKNTHERQKFLSSKILTPAIAERSVFFSKVPDFVKEMHIQMVVNKIIDLNTEKVLIMYEKPIVTLESTDDTIKLLNNLKQCFRIDRRISHANKAGFGDQRDRRDRRDQGYGNRGRKETKKPDASNKLKMLRKKISKTDDCISSDEEVFPFELKQDMEMDDKTAMQLLEESELRQAYHLDQLRLATFENEVFVDAEQDSINFVSFHHQEDTMDSIGFCCQSFDDKGGKFTARAVTKMPETNMIAILY